MQLAVLHAREVAADPALLSAAERAALVAIRGERRRDEWIRGRLAIRRVLGDPETSIVVAPDGAPEPIGGAPCNVSLSHDGEWIAVAIAGVPVGIDLCLRAHGERVARILRWLEVRGDVEPLAAFAALEAVLKLRRWPIENLRERQLRVARTGSAGACDRALEPVGSDEIVVRGLGDDVVVQVRQQPDYVVAWATA